MKVIFILFSVFIGFISNLSAQEGYPKPPHKSNSLFYMQHSEGHNTYVYEANIVSDKQFDNKKPVEVYRIMFDEDGAIKPLTKLQQQFAYGIKSKPLEDHGFELRIAAYADQLLYLKKDKNGKPFVETTLNGRKFKINRIFIKQKEGSSGLNIKVDYLIFYGTDHQGKEVQEKLFP